MNLSMLLAHIKVLTALVSHLDQRLFQNGGHLKFVKLSALPFKNNRIYKRIFTNFYSHAWIRKISTVC